LPTSGRRCLLVLRPASCHTASTGSVPRSKRIAPNL
jgi:hypothetical protein